MWRMGLRYYTLPLGCPATEAQQATEHCVCFWPHPSPQPKGKKELWGKRSRNRMNSVWVLKGKYGCPAAQQSTLSYSCTAHPAVFTDKWICISEKVCMLVCMYVFGADVKSWHATSLCWFPPWKIVQNYTWRFGVDMKRVEYGRLISGSRGRGSGWMLQTELSCGRCFEEPRVERVRTWDERKQKGLDSPI